MTTDWVNASAVGRERLWSAMLPADAQIMLANGAHPQHVRDLYGANDLAGVQELLIGLLADEILPGQDGAAAATAFIEQVTRLQVTHEIHRSILYAYKVGSTLLRDLAATQGLSLRAMLPKLGDHVVVRNFGAHTGAMSMQMWVNVHGAVDHAVNDHYGAVRSIVTLTALWLLDPPPVRNAWMKPFELNAAEFLLDLGDWVTTQRATRVAVRAV